MMHCLLIEKNKKVKANKWFRHYDNMESVIRSDMKII